MAVLLVREYNRLLLDSLSPPLASVAGADSAFLEYFFALLLTLSIVVSLKIIGALLVEALVVVPAAAARNVARGTRSYLIWSVGGRVPRRRRRPRHLDALAGADRRRGRAGGERDLLRHAGGRARCCAGRLA